MIWILRYPLALQSACLGTQFKMAHGDAHVDALQIRHADEAVVPLVIILRSLEVEMKIAVLFHDPPWLFV